MTANGTLWGAVAPINKCWCCGNGSGRCASGGGEGVLCPGAILCLDGVAGVLPHPLHPYLDPVGGCGCMCYTVCWFIYVVGNDTLIRDVMNSLVNEFRHLLQVLHSYL